MIKEKLIVVVVVALCGPTTMAAINIDRSSHYCSQVLNSLKCVFTNTSEDVELKEVGQDVLRVSVEDATTLRGSPPCGTALHVFSSANVTLHGGLTDTVVANNTFRQRRNSGERHIGDTNSPVSPLQSASVRSTTSVSAVSRSVSRTSVSYSATAGEQVGKCVRNVSVVGSKLHWLRGRFDRVEIQHSEVGQLDFESGRLNVRNESKVSNFSASGDQVFIENTRMQLLSRLEVRQQLQLHHVDIGTLASPGLQLHQPQKVREPVSRGYGRVHNLSEVKVNLMETGAVRVMGGRVFITNMNIDEALSAAIIVQDGGVLTLTNVHVHGGSKTCLILQGKARVVLVNFTLGSDTISYLNIASRGSKESVYPLRTMWPAEGSIGLSTKPGSEDEGTSNRGLPGFPWYWIMIMAVVGIFAGIIVGSAIMWRRRPSLIKGQPSELTLSDLIGRDRRLQEDTESQASNTLQRPEFLRQDSGLTSSSFASFTPCQERPPTVSLFPEPPNNPESQPSPDPELSVYIRVAPLTCTREEVIFEEVEALPVPKSDAYHPVK